LAQATFAQVTSASKTNPLHIGKVGQCNFTMNVMSWLIGFLDLLKLLVHLVATQLRSNLLIYVSGVSYLRSIITYSLTANADTTDVELQRRVLTSLNGTQVLNVSLQSHIACVRKDAAANVYFGSPGKCVDFDLNTAHINMFLNYQLLISTVIVYAVCLYKLWALRIRDIGDAKYIYATRVALKSSWFNLIELNLLMATVLLVLRHLLIVVWEATNEGDQAQLTHFLDTFASQIIVLVYSALKLKFPGGADPTFNDSSPEFLRIRFVRGWISVVNETNADFVQTLQIALYEAKYGSVEMLEGLLHSKHHAELDEVIAALSPAAIKEDIEAPAEAQATKAPKVEEPNTEAAPLASESSTQYGSTN